MVDVIRDGGDNSRLQTYRCQKKKTKFCKLFGLKVRVFLYWMLVEDILDYTVVSGLVNLDQSGQGSSFSGLLASPCMVSQIDLSGGVGLSTTTSFFDYKH